ncbi:MAG: hypothetical protein J7578_07055 [Chitinophagaceae bacterium]|nr:hypothetical protein [Chitinophagaceae bacterium]
MKMMFRYCCALLLLLSSLPSCNSASPEKAETKKKNAFDLEGISFTEAVPSLYSKHIEVEEGIEYRKERDGELKDSLLRYRIHNTITDAMRLTVPQQEFGYLYRSPRIDSIALFQETWFQKLLTLTDTNKRPVAYFAEAEFKDPKERKKALDAFIQKYGNPIYAFQISHEFHQCSYEWQLKDRTIQIETSNGFSVSFGGSDTTAKQNKYYTLDLLIIDNRAKQAIHDAHIYEFPEKILYNGKLHSYKDFQFEKKQVFRDNFLLNSTNGNYVKNEYGEYDITPEDEE